MHDERSNKDNSLDMEQIQKITSSLGGAAGWLIVMYAIAYLIGFEYLRNYLGSLGVPWAIGMYGPMDVIQAPSALGALAAMLSLQFASNHALLRSLKLKHLVIAGVATIVAIACHFIVKFCLRSYTSHWLLPAILFGSIAVLLAAALGFRLFTGRYGLAKGSVMFSIFALVLLIMTIPIFSEQRAATDIERVKKGKFRVEIEGGDQHEWQLIRAMPDSQLLIARVKEGNSLSFRIIPATGAVEIKSSK